MYELARFLVVVICAACFGATVGFDLGEESEASGHQLYESNRRDIVRRTYIDNSTNKFMALIGDMAFVCEPVLH